MLTVPDPTSLPASPRPVTLAIGFFDGVHLGHQQVLRQAVADATRVEGLSVAVTFDRHPISVVAPDRAPSLIHPLPLRLRAIAELGLKAALVLPFDVALSQVPGEAFIRRLHQHLGPIHSICVGSNFKFGHRRSGHVDLLKSLGRELGFHVHGLAAVALDGEVVSSTRVRQLIQEGRLDAAGQMLGRPYALGGSVQIGDRLGHKLGFPTANLDVSGLILPPGGVYAAHALLNGLPHRAVLNIGRRPTLRHSAPELRVEVHLLDFSGDLYGSALEVVFVERLRDELRFPDLEALRRQIEQDVAAARTVFSRTA